MSTEMTAKICRICLDSTVRLHEISDSQLRDVYEKLTNKKVQDGSPHLACYICYQQLRNCLQLVLKAHRSEELLKQMLAADENLQSVSESERQKYGLQTSLVMTDIEYYNIVQNLEANNEVKTEDKSEMYGVKIECEPEVYLSDTEELPEEEAELEPSWNEPTEFQPEKCTEVQTKKQYKCEYCSYSSERRNGLNRHVRIHTGERPYSCPECSFRAATSGQLKVHLRTHSGERPYKCPHCDCCFIQSSSLKIHIRTHTGEKPYSCQFCDYKCSENRTLKAHIRVHTGEKPFKCQYCSYTCKQKSNLNTHIRTHTGAKPYKCTYCSFTCTTSCYLNTHIRTHTGGKPYKCTYCSFSCVTSSSLKIHIRTHTGEKPYACEFCDRKFTGNCGLKKHMRIHENESTEKS